jgi:hypothetical protein
MIWLEMLRTPMAAPETRVLRAMRLTILACLSLLAMTILALAPLRSAIGVGAGGIAAGLLAALAILVPVYATAKNRADDAYLDQLAAANDAGEAA